jgi:hypothetical protein
VREEVYSSPAAIYQQETFDELVAAAATYTSNWENSENKVN